MSLGDSGQIHFIITGGTIDSIFSPEADGIVVNDRSVIADYIDDVIKPHKKITYEILCLKDSRDITDDVRRRIMEGIQNNPSSSIIVTHGTYTMVETAQFLEKNIKIKNKTIILTGAMIPLKGFCESDAQYNLGYAVAAVQFMKPGIYVAMNSFVFELKNVQKDVKAAKFKSF